MSKDNETTKGELYTIVFPPEKNGANSEVVVVESLTETAMIKFIVQQMGITLMKSTARDVFDSYERGEGVIKIDVNGTVIQEIPGSKEGGE